MPLVLATTAPGQPGSEALAEPEIFASLQGEGPSAGKPCAFVRLSRCHLACVWCDTAYTWRFEGDERPHRSGETYARAANQVTLSEDDAAARIAALGKPRLVVTGGEPLLQAAALARMLAILREKHPRAPQRRLGPQAASSTPAERGPSLRWDSHLVEIETNGTVAPPPVLDALVHQYNVSPKLAHSGNPAALALIPERLAGWAAEPRACFKFVVAEPADVDEVIALRERYAIPSERIYLMAEGTDAATLAARDRWLAELCLAHNLTLSRRLHIELYGDTRGT
ncbi:MAG TPA: 7-carboxy-7-deazaguanine synthase QueE [Croceibacterium sp.]|nr:7-carboxy-7-deazaguanine synthase QueE [Croceibacterium sp.]